MNLIQFLKDFSIEFSTSGSKHNAPGWVQVHCPFCEGSRDFHLGYNEQKDFWNCWRCGFHPTLEVLSALTGMDWREARDTLIRYKGRPGIIKEELERKQPAKLVLPSEFKPLKGIHRAYLKRRNFDPYKLEEEYNLLGTGPLGGYKFRIIAPIYLNTKLVSYQGRDITDQSEIKYKACKKENEVRDHKHCLYNLDRATSDTVIVVEGITDVWRLGKGSVGTFGIGFTMPQVTLLRRFKRRFIAIEDPEAMEQMEKLAYTLGGFGGETVILEDMKSDPGDLPQDEADSLMKEIGLK